ncbi:MAG: alpha-hydroxy-acid oxidizing protein [Planctomycetaceae bacterium]|jgi:isopentenyl diphosphate isomerase/L-lactate dehydrogenase-like FMN-dependent dehydrogenase|nr:alpha-hydroxy-acid oxidizing protein [Planctomycetaceae bacterium]MBT6156329.1 alpha-hydroxy-acid oxidizing protein [Planctomycetaceae bacterium]MBT6483899.1 alpha-hydroxy-acid oxidizing protein [Planctomycetaceae bacterium]MBT6496076.1 alpha-hydroxy-acid oxidizing protein [Planctomycetaceae bacterium]
MDRRAFTQLLTMGAGTLPLLGADAADNDNLATDDSVKSDDVATSSGKAKPTMPEPVNVADFQKLAESRMQNATYNYITTGSADEITLRENVEAFRRMKVFPPLLKGVSKADLSTTVMKRKIDMPILLAPVAAQRMFHPEGALASARAAAAAKTVFAVSSSVGHSVEEVARAAAGPKWFQLYVPKDRAVARQLVQRIDKAGYEAIIVTVDLGEWKDADRRDRFTLPKEMLVKHLRDVGYTQVTNEMSNEEVQAFNLKAWEISLSWEFFGWLRSITKTPLLIKGVLRKDDAEKAVSLGIDGIVVSNHGGRRLDGMPASIEMLPDIVQAVKGRAEVYMDGGIRRGTDVLKALALGARGVLVGRPYAWALGADGEAGVRKVLTLLREEFENAMVSTGCSKVSDINRSLLMS